MANSPVPNATEVHLIMRDDIQSLRKPYIYYARLLICKYTSDSRLGHNTAYLHTTLRGRPFNSWGGGGWFRKKISCKPLSEEKNCMQHKWNIKKILALLQARKKKCCKAISSFQGDFTKSQQNCNHSSLAPFKLWSELVMLQNVQCILSFIGSDNLWASEPLQLA